MAYLVYPVLQVGFSTVKRPKAGVGIAGAVSGRETRINYWTYPMYEWDLMYEYLPDDDSDWQAGITSSDIKTMMAFVALHGDFLSFRYQDPDDFEVFIHPIATGDGTTASFLITRIFGAGGYTITEPVGYVNLTAPFNVYANAVLVNPIDYTVDQSVAYDQRLIFNTPPAGGVVITVDMKYDYIGRFKDPSNDFEKFQDRLWSLKKITLMSTRE